MATYDREQKENFYQMVKLILANKNMTKLIHKISKPQIYEMICYLDANINSSLIKLLEEITGSTKNILEYTPNLSNVDRICNKIILFHSLCKQVNIKFSDVLLTCKATIIKAGAQKNTKGKNIIMMGTNFTLGSIIHRDLSEEEIQRIDHNLIQGAKERKEFMAKNRHKKPTKRISHAQESLFDKDTPIKLSEKQHVTTEVSTHPDTEGSHQTFKHKQTIYLDPDETVKDYQQALETLKSVNPKTPEDIPLSPPLDEPPVGASGFTLITPQLESVVQQELQKQDIGTETPLIATAAATTVATKELSAESETSPTATKQITQQISPTDTTKQVLPMETTKQIPPMETTKQIAPMETTKQITKKVTPTEITKQVTTQATQQVPTMETTKQVTKQVSQQIPPIETTEQVPKQVPPPETTKQVTKIMPTNSRSQISMTSSSVPTNDVQSILVHTVPIPRKYLFNEVPFI